MGASTVKSTTLSFGVVTAPVALRKVADKKEISFQLASPAGNGVKQVYVDEVTGEIVGPNSDCLKGIYDDPKGKTGFHEVPKEAIAAIDASVAIDGLVIDGFLPIGEVPFERAEAAYYVAPAGKTGMVAAKPLALLREAMEKTGKAGYGKLTMRSKQRAFVVYAENGGLLLNTLVYAEDFARVVEAAAVLEGVATDEKTVDLACTLIEAQSGERADLDAYTDDSRALREDLVAQALAGQTIEVPEVAEPVEAVIDLEAALLASIGQAAPKAAKKKAA